MTLKRGRLNYSLSGLSGESDTKQVQALTLCFSRETIPIVDNLGLSEEERGKVTSIIAAAFEQYVQGQINETVECRNFRKRVQQQGESFDDFLVSLRELAKMCNFCTTDCEQRSIRDQIIEGILDGETKEVLLRVKNLTLDATIDKCRAQKQLDANESRSPATLAPPFRPSSARSQTSTYHHHHDQHARGAVPPFTLAAANRDQYSRSYATIATKSATLPGCVNPAKNKAQSYPHKKTLTIPDQTLSESKQPCHRASDCPGSSATHHRTCPNYQPPRISTQWQCHRDSSP